MKRKNKAETGIISCQKKDKNQKFSGGGGGGGETPLEKNHFLKIQRNLLNGAI